MRRLLAIMLIFATLVVGVGAPRQVDAADGQPFANGTALQRNQIVVTEDVTRNGVGEAIFFDIKAGAMNGDTHAVGHRHALSAARNEWRVATRTRVR